MAIMYPKSIAEYMPTESERIVYQELKNQLPDSFSVFYSVEWSTYKNGKLVKSESDFIITSPEYGYLCLEVKGGNGIRIENNVWYVKDNKHGERRLNCTPYEQAEKSMYYFKDFFSNTYHSNYQGIFGAGVIFPFYTVEEKETFSNRNKECTIDSNDINNIYSFIKRMFKIWGGASYGFKVYRESQHKAFLELLRKRIAISAAAGALIKYKEQQLDVINRVQDNYIYFIKNIKQFYMCGGAGTGKTWISMKMAKYEAAVGIKSVLYICASKYLSSMVKKQIGDVVDVLDIETMFSSIIEDFEIFEAPLYEGVIRNLKTSFSRYDAIFVDEAQDFTEEWAKIIRKLLKNQDEGRLGVFYDDIQILREYSFGEGFGIEAEPYLLRENIRNTANIYSWASSHTNLGTDVIANPVEGPTPITEYIRDKNALTHRLETLFKEYFDDEELKFESIVIISDNTNDFMNSYTDGIAKWKFNRSTEYMDGCIRVVSVEEFKGLEADMIIYIHDETTNDNVNYIAYTRAKYYLLEFVWRTE
ncbi:NERD domain-containing protein [Anaerocolumna chitinilytica]|uniref:NERD domain-containing protein n=1 Tax=Anaerocolumna chitinilytica TaxID=1727145 RepID=A0A7I8DIP0_9FIRM|nr:NERD domain-containing protein [Anaerocolumna chitinilytica]BCJ97577.1 hypothetical protein bsdcttw_06180 [Anaerocolumna chitinilytica]